MFLGETLVARETDMAFVWQQVVDWKYRIYEKDGKDESGVVNSSVRFLESRKKALDGSRR